MRADIALVDKGLASSRSRAKELIEQGKAFLGTRNIRKASEDIADSSELRIEGEILPFVSRGGLKLKKAIEFFGIDTKDKVCADIGASTGGFCDCLLQNGAAYVYAVDCGHGQLADKLLSDSRVENREGVNARYMLPEEFDRKVELVTCDASFISLILLLPAMSSICSEEGELVCLIKPQFEAGKDALNKKGVVKDRKQHRAVIEKISGFALDLGLKVKGLTFSPIRGPEGNIEYLIYLSKSEGGSLSEAAINRVVEEAFDGQL